MIKHIIINIRLRGGDALDVGMNIDRQVMD